jgi:hypothetical protein
MKSFRCYGAATFGKAPDDRRALETWLTPEPTAADGDKLAQTRIVRDDIVRRIDALAIDLASN